MIEKIRNTYLFVVPNRLDVERLDAAIEKGELGCNKIGTCTYLGFFEEVAGSAYQSLKGRFGVEGEIHWIQLPHAQMTFPDSTANA